MENAVRSETCYALRGPKGYLRHRWTGIYARHRHPIEAPEWPFWDILCTVSIADAELQHDTQGLQLLQNDVLRGLDFKLVKVAITTTIAEVEQCE